MGDTVFQSLNVSQLTKFISLFCLPRSRLLCFTVHYIGGAGRGHCEPLFTRGSVGGFSQEMTFAIVGQDTTRAGPGQGQALKIRRTPRRWTSLPGSMDTSGSRVMSEPMSLVAGKAAEKL